MTTVGYGDVHAINTQERMIVMLAMLVATGVYAYTLDFVGKKVREYNMLARKYRVDMLYMS
jgi:hypothetical protein